MPLSLGQMAALGLSGLHQAWLGAQSGWSSGQMPGLGPVWPCVQNSLWDSFSPIFASGQSAMGIRGPEVDVLCSEPLLCASASWAGHRVCWSS